MGKAKKTKEKAAPKKNHGVGLHSIKFKILILVIGAIVATAVINLATSLPEVKSDVTSLVKNYMNDMAKISGENVDREIAFAGADAILTAEELGKMLSDVNVEGMSSSYTYVVSADGTMLYHPTPEKIGQPVENAAVKQLLAEMSAGNRPETDVITYNFKGTNKYASYYIGSDMSFIIIVTADEKEALSTVTEIMVRSIVGAILALLICGVIGVLTAVVIAKPIEQITKELVRLGTLDFTGESQLGKYAKRKDETGLMAQAAMTLQEKLVAVVRGLKGQSQSLFGASDAMNNSGAEINRSIEQVEKAVTEIADGATSQAQETQTATENVIVMGDMILETNQEVETLRDNARTMRAAGEQAMEILGSLSATNQETKDAIQVIYEQTLHTNDSVSEIKKATDIIADIAEETNLLSLNASIEAARAGEAGRGFAVVASQIQQLADQSNASASQIATTIASLIEEFEETVKTMEAVKKIIAKQDDDVHHTETAFKEVSDGITKSIDGIRSIATKTNKLDEARVRVVDVVQNLTAIAEENAASSEETSATVSTVGNAVTDVANNAEALYQIASDLDENISQFRLDDEVEAAVEE